MSLNHRYKSFLEAKQIQAKAAGIAIAPKDINPILFSFQRDIVVRAVTAGKYAIFSDCGTGKSFMQCEWAHQVQKATGGNVLILAPLAVAQQTIREAAKLGITIKYCRNQSQFEGGIAIANYEMLEHFDVSQFIGIVLDESSILKAYTGKIRNQIIESFANTPYRLACSATPSPNDVMELGNHAEFLGVMNRTEMLSMFFVHDGGETQKWRLKGHAESEFWKWVCSWAVMLRKPSDLGYSDDGFDLPELVMHSHVVESDLEPEEGMLFAMEAKGLLDRRQARRASLNHRVAKAAELANASNEPWLIWCDLNDEGDALEEAIADSIQVSGSDTPEHKESAMLAFASGELRVLITKPSIAGFGMNWQHCNNVAFVGLSDSYEQFYQAIRRCWRFGQTKPVNCHVIYAEAEGAVIRNIERKEEEAKRMGEEMVKHLQLSGQQATARERSLYERETASGLGWTAHLGDCVEVVSELESDSIDYSIFSPPFASLYTYSNSDRDMGNCKDDEEFSQHFEFLVEQLFRVIKPGRLVSFHCMNLPTSKQRHGYIGIRDFRGELIRTFEKQGFIFHSEVCIWKDPVTAMQRTKAIGLLYKQLKKDSTISRQGIPDYLVTMRKPGDNPEPVTKEPSDFPVAMWQRYASPVWMDINPSNTLQKDSAREEKDERHICPLQLEVIERAIALWTNPNDLVLSPFMGIGSEGYTALKMRRQFVGAELKPSYFKQAVANLDSVANTSQLDLLELLQPA